MKHKKQCVWALKMAQMAKGLPLKPVDLSSIPEARTAEGESELQYVVV